MSTYKSQYFFLFYLCKHMSLMCDVRNYKTVYVFGFIPINRLNITQLNPALEKQYHFTSL
jgi:hypothetical protein